jgi:hypothetical protein
MRSLPLVLACALFACGDLSPTPAPPTPKPLAQANPEPPRVIGLFPPCAESDLRLWSLDCKQHCLPDLTTPIELATSACYRGSRDYGRLLYFAGKFSEVAEVRETAACSGAVSSRYYLVTDLRPQPSETKLWVDPSCEQPAIYRGYVAQPRPIYYLAEEIAPS